MAGSREAPHVPRLRCGQAAESALPTRKALLGKILLKNVPRLLQAHGGCLLDANACIKMKDSRGAAIQGSERADCIAERTSELHCWASKLLKMTFGEISTQKKFREKFPKNIFQSSNPRPHLATDEVWRLTLTKDNRRAQV